MSADLVSFAALVLDDDEEIVNELSEAIVLMGGNVDAFSNPVECLEYLDTHRSSYDAVIVDLAMPRINGLEFLKKASHLFANSPRQYLVTGLADVRGNKVESDEMLTVMQKPISFTELKEKLGRPLLYG